MVQEAEQYDRQKISLCHSEMIESKIQVPETSSELPLTWTANLKASIRDKLSTVEDTEYLIVPYPNREEKIKAEFCIYRVPEKLRKLKEDGYNPRVVSIGPFHRDKDNLAPMLQHKLSYMASFLDQYYTLGEEDDAKFTEQTEKYADECLEECINTIKGFDKVIRQCYIEEIRCKDYELAEMMLIDGCFILELFLRSDRNFNYMEPEDYKSDPVLNSAWIMAALKHDLALLENQIPFFILEILYDIIWPRVMERANCKAPKSVAALALSFFQPMSQKSNKKEHLGTEYKHLLDLLHKFYFFPAAEDGGFSTHVNDVESNPHSRKHSSAARQSISTLFSKLRRQKHNPRTAEKKWGFNYCASELLESGIEFQAKSSPEESLSNINFNPEGVINIPELFIQDATSISLFRNLIAFEQCSLNSKHHVTSYAFLMRSLISSSLDSKLLKRSRIIQHSCIGDEEYLTNQFKSLVEGVVMMDDYSFRKVCDEVNAYHKPWYNLKRLQAFLQKQRRILWTNYLSSAWKVMSILAALTILIFTSLQTYYTIHPRH